MFLPDRCMPSEWPRQEVSGTVIAAREVGGIALTEHVYDEGTRFAPHSHSNALLTLVVNGHYRETLADRVEECRPRSVRFLPAGAPHEDEHLMRSTCLVVRLDAKILQRTREYAAGIERPGELNSPSVKLFGWRLYHEFRMPDRSSELAIEALIYEILVEAARCERDHHGAGPAWMRAAKAMLRENFAGRLTIEQIATHAGVHPVHLCREFRKQEGCTVGDHLRWLRVQHACRLLLERELSLAAIAVRSGFCDQSHFSSVFKKLVGMSPGEYRACSE